MKPIRYKFKLLSILFYARILSSRDTLVDNYVVKFQGKHSMSWERTVPEREEIRTRARFGLPERRSGTRSQCSEGTVADHSGALRSSSPRGGSPRHLAAEAHRLSTLRQPHGHGLVCTPLTPDARLCFAGDLLFTHVWKCFFFSSIFLGLLAWGHVPALHAMLFTGAFTPGL